MEPGDPWAPDEETDLAGIGEGQGHDWPTDKSGMPAGTDRGDTLLAERDVDRRVQVGHVHGLTYDDGASIVGNARAMEFDRHLQPSP